MRNRPGSVAMVGFTGAVKFMTSRGGVVLLSCAVKCVATLPTNNRRDTGLKLTERIENPWQQRAQRHQWHQTAIILEQKVAGKIHVVTTHPGAVFIRGEVGFAVVVAELPVCSFDATHSPSPAARGIPAGRHITAVAILTGREKASSRPIDNDVLFVGGMQRHDRNGHNEHEDSAWRSVGRPRAAHGGMRWAEKSQS